MTHDELLRAAARFWGDHDAGRPDRFFARPLGLTIPESYEFQAEVARLREQRGERVIGYKIGCTSAAVQAQLGIDQPIFGRLFDTGRVQSGGTVSHARYVNLAVEGELAIRLASDQADAYAIESIFPVIELHNYIFQNARPSCADLIASNGMHAGFVAPETESRWVDRSESARALSITINGGVVGAVTQPWAMGSPINALNWLARSLRPFGLRLEPGQVILTGSTMSLFPVAPGCRTIVEAPPLARCEVGVAP